MNKSFDELLLIADDDEEDCEIIRDALRESISPKKMHFVHDGEELMNYLFDRKVYAKENRKLLPSLILLDLHMPKKNGKEVLREIKAEPLLRSIPVVALTTSSDKEDILATYKLGIDAYITKPDNFDDLVLALEELVKYWENSHKKKSLQRAGKVYVWRSYSDTVN